MRVWLSLFGLAASALAGPNSEPPRPPHSTSAIVPVETDSSSASAASDDALVHSLSDLEIWDNGLCEMSYYRAVDQVYGTSCDYVRVHLVNRQWMGRESGVKVEPGDADAVAVFKLNIAEEIPTENYNYRYLTTVFLERPDLSPFKMVTSTQEWCGATFKQLRWSSEGGTLKTLSYFGDEGDTQAVFRGDAVPFEALYLIARDVAAGGKARTVQLLARMRSNHAVEPVVREVQLVPGPIQSVTVASGRYSARRVDLIWDGPQTGFLVEAVAPYRLLRFRAGSTRGELLAVERRAYWDRNKKSAFHKPGEAP
ncbi:MAG: hypothetical protein IIB60_05240 [Planctomycetes bacterium]|nr:hypothetical protein [Planctomycetota bacterium]